MAAKILILLLGALALAGILNAPVALAAGMLLGVTLGNPWLSHTSLWSKRLLQLAVVGLGFGISLGQVWEVGRQGVVYTVVGITATLGLGHVLGRALGLSPKTATLLSFGTAICGGSAIAAMAPAIGADDDDIGVSLATVFSLNALALFLFPHLGRWLGLSEVEFGYWAALAIHDTSSVVAAGSVYGATALAVATTVKLARAAWIAPFALGAAWLRRRPGSGALPWFILGFVAAAALRQLVPQWAPVWDDASQLAKHALVLTLFLIGTGMSRSLIARVGLRPLLHGTVLWAVVAAGTLLLVTSSPALR